MALVERRLEWNNQLVHAGQTSREKIVVGLDFGTTFSGVAIVLSTTPNDVEIIKTWPGSNNSIAEKVPTELAYTDNGVKWGSLIKPEESRIRCIKLFLDHDQKLPPFVSARNVDEQLRRAHRTVVECVTDYLIEVGKHTLDTLNKRYTESVVQSTPIEFVLTVPAVWSDIAQNATLTAARNAGMKRNLRIISEPEAAACYSLKTILSNQLKIGQLLLICDAGGGTVDLITYRICSLEPLRVKESGIGTGGLCGAAFLNFRFEDHIKSKIGNHKFRNMRTKTWQTGLRYFDEYVKRRFNDKEDEEFAIPFPGLADDEEAGIDCGFMALSNSEVRSIFEPVVNDILALIQGQIDAAMRNEEVVSAILLVGGFGQSEYLFSRVQKQFVEDTHTRVNGTLQTSPPPKVMRPPHAWTAVVRGAVQRGLEGSVVTERRSRYSYGVTCNTTFNSDIHPQSSRFWDSLREGYYASNVMSWFLKKGELVTETRAIRADFRRNFEGNDFPLPARLRITEDLLANSFDTAPIMYEKDDVKRVCTLNYDLNDVPRHEFKKKQTSTGEWYWRIAFELEVCIDSAHLDFSVKVGNKSYKSVSANFND